MHFSFPAGDKHNNNLLTLTTFKVILITPISFYLYDTGTTKYVLVITLYTTLAFCETNMLKISPMETT